MNLKSVIDLKASGGNEVAIFCGAGISKNSGLPLANELKQYILRKLPIDEDGQNDIMESNLPFEAFVETLSENADISTLLSLFEHGEPIAICKWMKPDNHNERTKQGNRIR